MVDLGNLCKCGHDKALHYQYVLNGRDQWRCKWCDPFHLQRGKGGNFVVTTEVAARDKMADHEFVALEARPEVVTFMQKVKDSIERAHGHINAGLTPPEALGKLTVRGMSLQGFCHFTWDDETILVQVSVSKVKLGVDDSHA